MARTLKQPRWRTHMQGSMSVAGQRIPARIVNMLLDRMREREFTNAELIEIVSRDKKGFTYRWNA